MEIPRLDVISPAPRQIWRELLEWDPAANIYQTPEWIDSICAVGGYVDISRLYVTSTGRQLLMPMVRRAGLPGVLSVEESLPSLWGTGGLVAAGQVQAEDVAAVWADLAAERAARVQIRPENTNAKSWNSGTSLPKIIVNPEVKSVIDLNGGFSRVWKERFRGEARTAVRRAERMGVVVESDSTGRLVPVYYNLYIDWVKRRAQERGLPSSIMLARARRVEPLRKFQIVAQKLGGACRIWVARLDDEPLAAIITLIRGTHANYWRGYSNRDVAGPVPVNNLLQKLAIEYACELDCLDYNMG
ncbi:MAG: GNAT family N-acetyltransferase, partial [Acidobacteria bacterium]|nr:GNAT family N-acetyltransferase [Acidobacteriota bacterium]